MLTKKKKGKLWIRENNTPRFEKKIANREKMAPAEKKGLTVITQQLSYLCNILLRP